MRQAIQELQPQGAKPGQAGLLWPVFLSALMTLGGLLGVHQTFGEHTPGLLVPVLAGLVAPASVALVGFLMFGNLIRVCGVLDSLSETAQKTLSNLITLFLGLTIAVRMQAAYFLTKQTLLIMALGLVAFMFDTAGGVLVAKLINLFLPKDKKLNPMIGACGISAFPMSARVVYKMAIKEDPQNYLLMQCVGVNVSGQVASVIAGGLLLNLLV